MSKNTQQSKKPRRQLTVHLDEKTHNKFMNLALAEGKTRSAILLEMVQSYCEDL